MGEAKIIGEKFLTVKAVARRLSVSDKYIYALLSERRMPYIKVGNAYRILESELEEYLEKRHSKAT